MGVRDGAGADDRGAERGRDQAWVSFEGWSRSGGVGRTCRTRRRWAMPRPARRRGPDRALPRARRSGRPVSCASASAPVCQRSRHSGARGATRATARAWRRASLASRRSASTRRRRTARGSPRPRGHVGRGPLRAVPPRAVGAGQRRRRAVPLGVGEDVVGEGHHGVARLGEPGVLHDDAHLQVAALVHHAVDHPGLEPEERARFERVLREARRRRPSAAARGPTMTRYASADTVCRCGVPPASPSGARPP